MSSQPLVYVVILNWNDAENTVECLQSVAELDYANARVVVVDNGSVDGSVDEIRSSCPNIDLVVNESNLGFAGGVNVGIEHAREHGAEYVFMLNNDTLLDRALLTELVQFADKHPEAGLLAPKIYYHDDPSLIWSAACRYVPFPPRVKINGIGRRDHARYSVQRRVNYVTGCAMFVRRDVLETVGGLDPIYWPIYHEDYDYCARIAKEGWEIWYVPTARMWHKESQSQRGSGTKAYNLGKNTVPFYLAHTHPPYLSLALFVGWVVFRELAKCNPAFVRPYLSGILSGLRGQRSGSAVSV